MRQVSAANATASVSSRDTRPMDTASPPAATAPTYVECPMKRVEGVQLCVRPLEMFSSLFVPVLFVDSLALSRNEISEMSNALKDDMFRLESVFDYLKRADSNLSIYKSGLFLFGRPDGATVREVAEAEGDSALMEAVAAVEDEGMEMAQDIDRIFKAGTVRNARMGVGRRETVKMYLPAAVKDAAAKPANTTSKGPVKFAHKGTAKKYNFKKDKVREVAATF